MEQYFKQIQSDMEIAYTGVARGSMMRSPALTYKSKVFAFFHKNEMGFKLDQKAALVMEQYPGSRYLNLFKNKPPMKGWLIIPAGYHYDWGNLAVEAYKNIVVK